MIRAASESILTEPDDSIGQERSAAPARLLLTTTTHRQLLELGRLVHSDIGPEEFHRRVLTILTSAVSAKACSLWAMDTEQKCRRVAQHGLTVATIPQGLECKATHDRLIHDVTEKRQPAVWSTESNPDLQQFPPAILVFVPILVDPRPQAVLEVMFSSDVTRPKIEQIVRFTVQVAELAARYAQARHYRNLIQRQANSDKFAVFAAAVHQSLDLETVTYTIVNDGRSLIGCDRLTLVRKQGNGYCVAAVSGQETLDARSSEVQALRRLAAAVAASGQEFCSETLDENYSPQIRAAWSQLQESKSAHGALAVPLIEISTSGERRTLGVLIAEQLTASTPLRMLAPRVRTAAVKSTSALQNAVAHDSAQGIRGLPVISHLHRWLTGQRSVKSAVIASLLASVVAAAVFLPADFELSAQGTLQPVEQTQVFARTDGIVRDVHVHHGQQVQPGELLIELEDSKLELAYADADGRMRTASEQLESLRQRLLRTRGLTRDQREQLNGELAEAQKTLASLQDQRALLVVQRDRLHVRSPAAGTVITWDVKRQLANRPVARGQVLFSLAQTGGPWELKVEMPADRLGDIHLAQHALGDQLPVSYVVATDPATKLHGRVAEIHGTAEVRGDEGNTVHIRVAVEAQNLVDPRPGADVSVKVHCGARALGYVWLHDPIRALQRLLFRFSTTVA